MPKIIKLPFLHGLERALASNTTLIQVIIGPRQVGKTTGIKQLLAKTTKNTSCYYSADGPLPKSSDWLFERWHETLGDTRMNLLVIDEIQNVENWSGTLKQVWDEAQHNITRNIPLRIVVLGSSSLSLQKGLGESLAGRFQLHRVHHWSLEESREAYGLDLETYLRFGGYPGAYRFIGDVPAWLSYIQTAIIDTAVGKDILTHARVKSPALFRQCFDIASAYPAQEISYTKLLGQLQDKGNTDLVKSYLEHYEGAYLLKQLFKFSNTATLKRSSSPKLLSLCPALYTVGIDADLGPDERGRSFELAVGMALLRLPGALYYWRERNDEVDYVYQFGRTITGIEVKSGRKKSARGLEKFKQRYPNANIKIITPENFEHIGISGSGGK